jgi:hypothetical protein
MNLAAADLDHEWPDRLAATLPDGPNLLLAPRRQVSKSGGGEHG